MTSPLAAGDGPGDTPAVIAKPAYCTCSASPWCTGPTGPGWLTCSASCKSCHPPKKRRRRSLNTREPEHAAAD